MRLSANQQAVFDLVKRSGAIGISGEALRARVWRGLETSHNIVSATVCHANRKLALVGLRIRSTGGPGSAYWLVEVRA